MCGRSRGRPGMLLFRGTLENIKRKHTGAPFEMVFWNGERWRFGSASGAPEFVIHFKTRRAWMRSVLQTTLGFGEAYVTGEVTIEGSLEDAITALVDHGLRIQARRSSLQQWVQRAVARSLP